MPRLNCCFKRSRLARAEALAEDGPDGASEEAGLAPVDPQGVVLTSETAEDATGAREEVGLAQDVGGASEDRPIRTSRVSNRSSLRASEDMNHVLGRLEQLDDERQGLRQQLQRLQVSQIMEEADPGSVRMSTSAGSSSAQPRFSQTGGRSRGLGWHLGLAHFHLSHCHLLPHYHLLARILAVATTWERAHVHRRLGPSLLPLGGRA